MPGPRNSSMAAFSAAVVAVQAEVSAMTENPSVSSSHVIVPWFASHASKMALITATCTLQLCPSTTYTTFGASSAQANCPWKIEVVGVVVTVVVVVTVDVTVVVAVVLVVELVVDVEVELLVLVLVLVLDVVELDDDVDVLLLLLVLVDVELEVDVDVELLVLVLVLVLDVVEVAVTLVDV